MSHFHSGDSTIASNCPKDIQDNNVTLRRKATDSTTKLFDDNSNVEKLICTHHNVRVHDNTVSKKLSKKPICIIEFFLNTTRAMIGRYSWSVRVNTHE